MTRTRAPWIILASAASMLALTLYLSVRNGSLGEDATFVVVAILMIVGYTGVGTLVASRRAGGPIGWLMMAVGIGFLLSAFTSEYVIYAFRTRPGSLPFGLAAAWANNCSSSPCRIDHIGGRRRSREQRCVLRLLRLFGTRRPGRGGDRDPPVPAVGSRPRRT